MDERILHFWGCEKLLTITKVLLVGTKIDYYFIAFT